MSRARFPEREAPRVLLLAALLSVTLNAVACRAPEAAPPAPLPSELADAPNAPDDTASALAEPTEIVPAYREPREVHPEFAEREYFQHSHGRYAGFGLLGFTHESRPVEVHAFRNPNEGSEKTARPHVLLLATIHGNEWAGTPLLERLVDELAGDTALLASRDITVIPVANPDGYAARRRHNAKGVDLNRNFPAANARASVGGTPLSEPESHALHDWLIANQPDLVISIHQPVGVVDWDGPADEIARVMSEASGLPAKRIGSRPGSLGSFLGVDRGVPVITLELPADARGAGAPELWARFGGALLVAVGWPGVS